LRLENEEKKIKSRIMSQRRELHFLQSRLDHFSKLLDMNVSCFWTSLIQVTATGNANKVFLYYS